jgi:phage shock protein PspC (stress-responsive transcriptional regulator)
MKKTSYININGKVYQIDEDAQRHLEGYLQSIRQRIDNSQDQKEVMDDIEARIGELFSAACQNPSEVVNEEMVKEAIRIIGEPEEIVDKEESSDEKKTSTPPPFEAPRKRLYRDRRNRVIAGVCGGLGAYFDVDPILFRLIFILSFFSGITIFLYIGFWIAMPEAITPAQRMEMGGFSKTSDETWRSSGSKGNQPTSSGLSSFINQFLQVLRVILGLFLSIGSFILLTAFVIGVLMLKNSIGFLDAETDGFSQIPSLLIPPVELNLTALALVLFFGIPLMALLYVGIKLIFNIRKSVPAINVLLFIAWLGSIGLLVYTGFKIANEFKYKTTVKTTIPLNTNGYKTIYLEPANNPDMENYTHLENIDHLHIWNVDGRLEVKGNPNINVVNGDSAFIMIEKSARGSDVPEANQLANETIFNVVQLDSIIKIDPQFRLPANSMIRNQQVKITIQLKRDQKLEVNPSLSEHINY